MTLKGAVDRIGVLAVTGVTNIAADAMPGVLRELPALVLIFNVSQEGLQEWMVDGSGKFIIYPEHVLLYAGLTKQASGTRMYDAITHVDNYLAALKTDWDLNGNLAEPLRVLTSIWGPYDWRGHGYSAVRFRHRWVLET